MIGKLIVLNLDTHLSLIREQITKSNITKKGINWNCATDEKIKVPNFYAGGGSRAFHLPFRVIDFSVGLVSESNRYPCGIDKSRIGSFMNLEDRPMMCQGTRLKRLITQEILPESR